MHIRICVYNLLVCKSPLLQVFVVLMFHVRAILSIQVGSKFHLGLTV